jgi:hypothetical protein
LSEKLKTLQYHAAAAIVTTTTTTTTTTTMRMDNITITGSSSVAAVVVMPTAILAKALSGAHLLSSMPDLPSDCVAGSKCSSSTLEAEDSSPSL